MSILIKPIVSEKANMLSETRNKYTFLVDLGSNKVSISQAIKMIYKVDVVSVNTHIKYPKAKSRRTKSGSSSFGFVNKEKRAIVEVREGQSIDVFDNNN